MIHNESQHIIPDFVDGFSFGNVVGLAVQSLHGSWAIQDVSLDGSTAVSLKNPLPYLSLNLKFPQSHVQAKLRAQSFNIVPLQTRIIPVTLIQTDPFDGTELTFKLEAISDDGRIEMLSITLPVKHHNSQSISEGEVIRGSFLFASSSPSLFLAMPPISKQEKPLPPILALREFAPNLILYRSEICSLRWRRCRYNFSRFLDEVPSCKPQKLDYFSNRENVLGQSQLAYIAVFTYEILN